MPSTRPIDGLTDLPWDIYRAVYMRSDQRFRDGLKRGIADIKAGKTGPFPKSEASDAGL